MADVLLVYWSGTGNTEIMAEKIREGIEDKGLSVDYHSVESVDPSDVLHYDRCVFGCPSMGVEVLEEDDFEPFFTQIEANLKGKKVALFGSYGWGDGEWMDLWQDRVLENGAQLFEKGLIINTTPSSEEEEQCFEFGQRFAEF
ncbi:MAG: flavodoxin [Acholeplasmataceae bacterium]